MASCLPILEAIIFSSAEPIGFKKLAILLQDSFGRATLIAALTALQAAYAERALHLVEVASGYQFRIDPQYASWVTTISAERIPRYSRALLETLVLIAYRQPITRAEIEEVRGVTVSSALLRTLLDRAWIKVVGHKEVPGRPALFATTNIFLDYFHLKSLRELPPLEDFANLDQGGEQLEALWHEKNSITRSDAS